MLLLSFFFVLLLSCSCNWLLLIGAEPIRVALHSPVDSNLLDLRPQVWDQALDALAPSSASLQLRDHSKIPLMLMGMAGQIELGTPPKRFTMMFNISSSVFWVPNERIGHHHAYNHSASTTYRANGTKAIINRMLDGFLSQEEMRFGSLQLRDQFFVEGTIVKDFAQLYQMMPFDGVLGMSFASMQEEARVDLKSPLRRLVESRELDDPVFAFHMEDATTGELVIGEIDKKRFSGSLAYVEVANGSDWAINVNSIRMKDETFASDVKVVFAPSPMFAGPPAIVKAMARIVGAVASQDTGLYYIDCNPTGPNMEFSIDGRVYTLLREEYVVKLRGQCFWVFMEDPAPSHEISWMMGSSFMAKYFTVFDLGTKDRRPRIGFAKAVKSPKNHERES